MGSANVNLSAHSRRVVRADAAAPLGSSAEAAWRVADLEPWKEGYIEWSGEEGSPRNLASWASGLKDTSKSRQQTRLYCGSLDRRARARAERLLVS